VSFSGLAITEQLSTDLEPVFSGRIIYQAQIDEQVISDYRHLKNTSSAAFNVAMRSNVVAQAQSFSDHTEFSLNDIFNNDSLNGAKNHAEHIINIASGPESDDYFDWDGDGRPENPGDDVGLLPYVRLFANALIITDADSTQELNNTITQIENHVSLMIKITASDTVAEASAHAEQLRAQQGQILQQIIALLERNQTSDFGIHTEIFSTGN
jgi:hypothetical protein